MLKFKKHWILLLKDKNAFIIEENISKVAFVLYVPFGGKWSCVTYWSLSFKRIQIRNKTLRAVGGYELKEVELADVLRRLKLILRHHQHLEWWFFLVLQHDSRWCCWRANSTLFIHKQVWNIFGELVVLRCFSCWCSGGYTNPGSKNINWFNKSQGLPKFQF